MKADCSAKFLMWPKFAFYLEICDPTLNKRHLVIQKSERSLKNMGSPAIAISQEFSYLGHSNLRLIGPFLHSENLVFCQ